MNKDPAHIAAEFKRLGISTETFLRLVRRSLSDPLPTGLAMNIGPETRALMKSLPDGIGEEGFIEAFRARFPEFGSGTNAGA